LYFYLELAFTQLDIFFNCFGEKLKVPYYTRNGYRLFYHHSGLKGKGQPVIFIHGYLGSSQSHWGAQLENQQLISQFEIIAPDLRGFAKSSLGKNVEKHKTKDHILDIHELLTQELKLSRKPIFVGYSIGGTLALLYSLKYHNVKAILLVSPRPFLHKTTRAWNFLSKEKRSGENKNFVASLLWKIVKRIQKGFTYIDTKRRRWSSKDYLKELSHLRIPILMLHGTKDTVNPSITFSTLKEYLHHNTEVIEFEGDHGITHEHPDEFNRILIEFIKKHD